VKTIIKILCAFIPSKKYRKIIRQALIKQSEKIFYYEKSYKFWSMRLFGISLLSGQTKCYKEILSKVSDKDMKTKFLVVEAVTKNQWSPLYEKYLSQDITAKYAKLVFGLDEISKATDSLMINRMRQCMKDKKQPSFFEIQPFEIEKPQQSAQNIYDQIVEFTNDVFGIKGWYFPIKNIDLNVLSFECGISEIFRCDAAFSKSIIDVGACVGDSAMVFCQYAKNKIYSFEPSPLNYELLLKTIELNNVADKIIPINKGLSDKKEFLNVRTDIGGEEFSLDVNADKNGKMIEIDTLDNFVEENNLDVGLIKVDIEAMEQKFWQEQ
jgi:FkbM family methyltransferase